MQTDPMEESALSPEIEFALGQEKRTLEAIEAEFGVLDEAQAADRIGHPGNARLVDSLRERGRILAYRRRGEDEWIYPLFQFEGNGVLSVTRQLLEVATVEGVDPMDLVFWLCSRSGMLEDAARPVDLLRADPEAVLEAARYDLGEHVW
ncbi:hypothetical protein [Sinomonas gamaensis]|uniref:hypothetical protein n=1 Tax=Sinomonas gamaensis TaxID=2565624 RepID=UPI001485EA6A|nr:hypothetical protein [Sinomonas gamaensis]